MRDVIFNSEQFDELSSAVLREGGYFRFSARGSSMFPALRAGDVLTIEPAAATDLSVGDIAFFHTPGNRVVVHRVIKIDRRNNSLRLIVRGDAAPGSAEALYPEQILGRVVTVRRGRRVIRLDGAPRRWLARVWVNFPSLGPWLLHVNKFIKLFALKLLAGLQALKIYRFIARKIVGGRVTYRLATREDLPVLSARFNIGGLTERGANGETGRGSIENQEVNGNTFVADLRGGIAGMVYVKHFPADAQVYTGAWLFSLIVRMRYRGSGIGEGLTRSAIEAAARAGAARLNLLVFERNQAALELYHKLGFRPASDPALARVLEQESQQGHPRRILLSKELG